MYHIVDVYFNHIRKPATYIQFKGLQGCPITSRDRRQETEHLFNHTVDIAELAKLVQAQVWNVRVRWWETIFASASWTPFIQQAGGLSVSPLVPHGDARWWVAASRFVAEALSLQLGSGSFHHSWVTEELQHQRRGCTGCG